MAYYIKDLKKDDIIYGFCIETQEVEIYGVEEVTEHQIEIYGIIGESGFYLNFPLDTNLEKPILCRYSELAWWIYTVNIKSLEPFINCDNLDFIADFHLKFYFDEYLDIWNQEIKEFEKIN